MPHPNLESFSQDLYDRVEPLTFADSIYDWPIAKLVYALGLMFQLVEDYGRDDQTLGAPGWSNAIDINRCPDEAIPWLGQFVGVRLPPGLTPAQQRAYVKDAPGWDRGTLAALVAAAQPYLLGQKSVTVRERFNQLNPNVDSPGYFQVTTRGSETVVPVTGTTPLALTVSGNEITDATRTANVQGDGRAAPDSSFGIWEAATNLITNGGFETNTTGWTPSTGMTLARTMAVAKFGTASALLTSDGVDARTINFSPINVTPGSVYAFSFWVRLAAGARTIKAQMNWLNSIGGTISADMSSGVLGSASSWQRVTLTAMAPATAATVRLYVRFEGGVVAAGDAYYVDGIQLEQRATNPLTALTVSGNEITDVVRTANVGGDGLAAPDSSYGIWEAATNLVLNGGFETNSNNWVVRGAATIARDATRGKFGTSSLKITSTVILSDGVVMSPYVNVTTGATYAVSAWVITDTPGVTVQVYWEEFTAANSYVTSHGSSVVALTPGVWTRIQAIEACSGRGVKADVMVCLSTGSAVGPIWIDGVQLEQRAVAPYAPLTVTGNEITDATRAAVLTTSSSGQMMDGLANDSSYGIRRAATNLFRNGQCDATTNWFGATGQEAITVDTTTPAPFSPNSIKCVTNGSLANEGLIPQSPTGQAAAPGTLGVGSVWIKGVAGQAYFAMIRWKNTDASVSDGAQLAFTATGAWQLVTPIPFAVAAGKTGDAVVIHIRDNGTRAETFWVAHAMLEVNQTVVAPYVATSGGATATHGASRVTAPASLINATQGWIAFRMRYGYPAGGSPSTAPRLFDWTDGTTNNRIIVYGNGNGACWACRRDRAGVAGNVVNSNGGVNDGHIIGGMATVIAAWDAGHVKISVNGSAFASVVDATLPLGLGATFAVGNGADSLSLATDSDILWTASGTGTLTDSDAASINGFGNVDARTTQFPTASVITAIWSADNANLTPPSAGIPATPYVHTDGASTSRAAARVQAPISLLNTTQSWVAMRVRMEYASTQIAINDNKRAFQFQDDGTKRIIGYYGQTAQKWAFQRDYAGAGTAVAAGGPFSQGDLVTLIFAWTATQVMISVNGGAFVKGPDTHLGAYSAPTLDFLTNNGNAQCLNSEVLWAATGTGILTDADAVTINAFGNIDPKPAQLPGTPTAVWTAESTALTPTTALIPSTPYVQTDGATASRAAARVQLPTSVGINTTQGWIAMRMRMGYSSGILPNGQPIAWNWGDPGPSFMQAVVQSTTGLWTFVRYRAGVGGPTVAKIQAFNAGDYITLVTAWDTGNIYISVNGSPFVKTVQGGIALPTIAAANVDIGTGQALPAYSSFFLDSDVFWTAHGIGTLTDADAATMNGYGNTDPDITVMPGRPTTLWKADTANAGKAVLTPLTSTRAYQAMLALKPAGLIMDYQVLDGNTYQTVYDNNGTYQILYDKYSTYQRLLDDVPG